MDIKTLAVAQKYANDLVAGIASGVASHVVDEENNAITFNFMDGQSATMKINTPTAKVEKAVNDFLNENKIVDRIVALETQIVELETLIIELKENKVSTDTITELETQIAELEKRIAELEESPDNSDTDSNDSQEDSSSDTSGDAIPEEVLPEGCMWIEQGGWDYEGNKSDSTTRVRMYDFVDISATLGGTLNIDVKTSDGSSVYFMARLHHKTSDDYVNANHTDGQSPFSVTTSTVATNNWYDKATIMLALDKEGTINVTPSQFDGVVVTIKKGSSVVKTVTLKAHTS